jgi:hypothetical protein
VDAALCLSDSRKHVVKLFTAAQKERHAVVMGKVDVLLAQGIHDEAVTCSLRTGRSYA